MNKTFENIDIYDFTFFFLTNNHSFESCTAHTFFTLYISSQFCYSENLPDANITGSGYSDDCRKSFT